jgi:hypothetical protein
MIGLRQTRVIIVDDDENDGMAIARDLWRLRVASLYFRGIEDVPEEGRIKGVRLAILDMDLLGGGTDEMTKLSALVGTLDNILDPANGPYAVIAWTGHPELVSQFEEYIARDDVKVPRPVHVLAIEKHSVKDVEGKYDFDNLLRQLTEHLERYSGLLFLRAWEEESFLAASNVVAELSQIAAPAGTMDTGAWKVEWDRGLRHIAKSLGAAVSGDTATNDEESALKAFYAGLGPLHADRLESALPKVAKKLVAAPTKLLAKDVSGKLPAEKVSRLNAMLHCSFEHVGLVHPGNVYARALRPKLARQLEASLFTREAKPENVVTIMNGARAIMIEVSAACDHAQSKVVQARLVPGLLVRNPQTQPLKKQMLAPGPTANLWSLGPIRVDVGDGAHDYLLVANFLYMTSASSAQLKKTTALFRLRPEAMADLQSKLAFHVGRTGKSQLE